MSEKILVVDDEIETLRLVGLTLQRQGYQIVAANNGEQALSMIQSEKPDLVILDIMMPDVDGFEVARQLRDSPATSNLPILMFSAKAQLDDKVTGYEAGADDYLTKPIHPAELVAHVKALLARSKERISSARQHGQTIGVLAPKGGLGTSTLTLNLATIFQQRMDMDVIAAELRPGHGSWRLEHSEECSDGLNNLLYLKPEEITTSALENELYRTSYGLRLLLSSRRTKDIEMIKATTQAENIVSQLSLLSPLVFLDLGNLYWPNYKKILSLCHGIIVVTAPYQAVVDHTRTFLEELGELGFGQARVKPEIVVMINCLRVDGALSVADVKGNLDLTSLHFIPPVPEVAHQAEEKGVPLVILSPESFVTQQFIKLVDFVSQHINPQK